MSAAPGFVDLQVNGYAGVDFNSDSLSAEGLHRACAAMRADGVAGFLPTVITDALPAMSRRLARLVELRAADPVARAMIPGLHIEGPFLSPEPGYRGAHDATKMTPATPDAMRSLLDAAGGLARLVTLAPEADARCATVALLARAGVRVAAGHCNATLDQLRAALDAGLSMYTHLGNGCPVEMPRHDNIVQRVLHLADRFAAVMFIADGVHVPAFALGNYVKLVGPERTVVVTDAMTAAGLGPGRYRLGRWEVDVGADGAAWAPDRSHLVGSAMTMRQAVALLRSELRLSDEAIEAMTARLPAALLGLATA